jgi:hypothetical protein
MSTATEIRLELPAPHPAQQQILDESRRYNVLLAGRRFGKSVLGRHLVIHEALKGRPACWVAPQYKYLLPSWRETCEVLRRLIRHKDEAEKHLLLLNGGEIDFWSADGGDPAQGRKYGVMVFDEAALIGEDLESLWTRSLRPTLTDLQGSAWFLSTPKQANSYLSTLFGYGQGERADWQSWRLGTAENPYILPEEIEQARKDLPLAAFQQEFLGESVSWSGSVFRSLEKAIVDAPLDDRHSGWFRPPPWATSHPEFFVGVDWAGAGRTASGDFTAFTVVANDGTVCHVDRFHADYALQRTRLAALVERYHPAATLCEGNSIGQPQIEALRRTGLQVQTFYMTNSTKARLVEQLALAFENQQVKIPDIENRPALLAELSAFEGKPLPNGMTRFSAASGSHDDLVISLLLAWESGHRPKWGERPERLFW